MLEKEVKRIRSEANKLNVVVYSKEERLSNREGFIDKDELEFLKFRHREAEKLHSSFMNLDPSTWKNWGDFLAFLRRHDRRLDQCEETFHRYNIPRNSDFSSPNDCLKAVKQFMRVWREESQRGRERGCKSLNEWLMIRRKNPDIDAVRLTEIDLGTRISICMGAYFALLAESSSDMQEVRWKIFRIVTAMKTLKVEKDRSVVIDMFFLAAKSAVTTMQIGQSQCFRSAISKKMESDLVHLILREVLRLEVAFSCPDLPMMVTEDVFTGMVNHLDSVFEQKLETVWIRINRLARELSLPVGDCRFWEAPDLYTQMNQVWNKLDLTSGDSSALPRLIS